ncbi:MULTISPECIES: hydantoinase B/oxoprolinase family protein [Streptomyces]|uniref:hydantoinase B/oxoprolinase family protein n=1 Tax=Streptomyces TaxID=1883 RepID=UPI0022499C29|nr:hydantoinase B/oxoprolinase family protein [Streptomyces sp. JHD 1]MCX2968366.1 hydantoinase B/oxoprolinase family protein [Streptomyces sp. JHD 1]
MNGANASAGDPRHHPGARGRDGAADGAEHAPGPAVDPVTVEIVRNALIAAADDMNATLMRSAYTPVIYECGDCVVALLDDEHQVLGQSAGLPIFLGNLESCTRATEERFGRDAWRPGDVWILNDSYLGGTHLNDVTIFGPVFVGGELAGFTATRAHWIDVGSKDPGGSMDSVTIFQEGLRMGPQKLVAGGHEVPGVVDTIATNVRFPYPTTGDMNAMVATIRMGQVRLAQIVERFGLATVRAAREEIFRQTEALERAVIARIPDGVYTAEGFLDNDGIDLDTPVAVRLRVTVAGSELTFDVTESADQTTGPVNCGVAQAVSACRVGYKLLVSPDVPGNGGSFRPLHVRVREGSVFGARPPAACQWYFSHLGLLIDLVAKALAPALPDRVAAASHGDSMVVMFAGTDPRVARDYVSLEATLGGWGAWRGSDGQDALINNVNGSLKDLPVEVFEARYPLRVTHYGIRPDSGGPGRWRGGNGVVREYTALADCTVSLWFERSVTPAWGLAGGRDAVGPEVVVNPGRPDERRMLKCNGLPLRAGDVVRCATGGGGGYGDAAERAPEAVRADVLDRQVSPGYAARVYGVSDPVPGAGAEEGVAGQVQS